MPNERLRAALLQHGVTPAAIGSELGVDQKTVERWIAGRLPYRRYRYALATRLGVDESYLWPDALPRRRRGRGVGSRDPGRLSAPVGSTT